MGYNMRRNVAAPARHNDSRKPIVPVSVATSPAVSEFRRILKLQGPIAKRLASAQAKVNTDTRLSWCPSELWPGRRGGWFIVHSLQINARQPAWDMLLIQGPCAQRVIGQPPSCVAAAP